MAGFRPSFDHSPDAGMDAFGPEFGGIVAAAGPLYRTLLGRILAESAIKLNVINLKQYCFRCLFIKSNAFHSSIVYL